MISNYNPSMSGTLPFHIKIVIFGQGEVGKTTTLGSIADYHYNNQKSNITQVNTTDKRTLLFDSIVLSLQYLFRGNIYNMIVQLMTTTGQERFLSTRENVLGGADGVIFIGDSSSEEEKINKNLSSFNELKNLIHKGKSGENIIPILIQLNKRDIKSPISVEDFKNKLELPSENIDGDNHKWVYSTIATKCIEIIPLFHATIEKIILSKNGMF